MAGIEERRRHQKTEEIRQPFPPTDLVGYQFGVVKNLSGRFQLQSVSDAIGEKLCVVQLTILVSQLLSLKHIELSTKIFTDEVIARSLAELRPTQRGRSESQPWPRICSWRGRRESTGASDAFCFCFHVYSKSSIINGRKKKKTLPGEAHTLSVEMP